MSREDMIKAVKDGTPLYITPYKEPKVWGVGGIGEYWYGAEDGEKSSICEVSGKKMPMDELLKNAPEELLGQEVVKKFGKSIPLVKILTPKGRLSVQFHDSKNELWIVTGLDAEAAGGEPRIIVGFSPEAVLEYGDKIAEKYKEALENYGTVLNALIDILEANFADDLNEAKDAVACAGKVKNESDEVKEALEKVEEAGKDLDKFYAYRSVKIGDVAPIPSGTLHALGAGVEVVEPQIAGPTQSLEDGATYPVRYYFPGHERAGAQKKLDLDRIGEMKPGVTPKTRPEIIKEEGGVTIERLPGDFEDKGLEVHRIDMNPGATLEIMETKSFHDLVVVDGEATLTTGGETYDIPNAVAGDKMMIIPASIGPYFIASKGGAKVIDTFTPV